MVSYPQIVVITPIKNESWILHRFLSTTSLWADKIIIADQNSTDSSIDICSHYDKVVVIKNDQNKYDEASRQILLIETARKLVEGPKILFALDADEILAANAVNTLGWQKILTAVPGTVIYLEKPDLYLSTNDCIRWKDNYFPIGYVDNNSKHNPKVIHSTRIPVSENTIRLVVHDVKVLHYGLANPDLQKAKVRFYSVVENIENVRFSFKRRSGYSRTFLNSFKSQVESVEINWFNRWENLGIDMNTINPSNFHPYHWHDFEVLKNFKIYGEKRFYWDDIWHFDWEKCRKFAKINGITDISEKPINKPSKLDQIIRDAIVNIFNFVKSIKHYFKFKA